MPSRSPAASPQTGAIRIMSSGQGASTHSTRLPEDRGSGAPCTTRSRQWHVRTMRRDLLHVRRRRSSRIEAILQSLVGIEDVIAEIRSAADMLEASIQQTRESIDAGVGVRELVRSPGDESRGHDRSVEAMHSTLMISRAEWYRLLGIPDHLCVQAVVATGLANSSRPTAPRGQPIHDRDRANGRAAVCRS